jgi:hypothetical protein
MVDKNSVIDESEFNDTAIELAEEIAKINAIGVTTPPLKNDPQIALKVDMELKKAESSSTNFFRVLRTLQEVQIYSDNTPVVVQGMQITTERKYTHSSAGRDQKIHPLTITESVVVSEESLNSQELTLEDLFEDSELENPSVVGTTEKKPLDADSKITDNDSQPKLPFVNKISDQILMESVNASHLITKNKTRQLKEAERDLIKNMLKMR